MTALLAHRRRLLEAQPAGDAAEARSSELLQVERQLLDATRGLVLSYVRRFRALAPTGAVDDYIDAGQAGLAEAIATFEPGRGRFPPWAYLFIRRHVLEAVWQREYPHLTFHDFQCRGRILAALRLLAGDANPDVPGASEVARLAGLTTACVVRIQAAAPLASLDSNDRTDANPHLACHDPDVATRIDALARGRELHSWRGLWSLTGLQRYILARRFGLDDEDPETLASIGSALGLSSEAVRRREAQALRVLAKRLA